jgi:2',5'-phosphodiesterase
MTRTRTHHFWNTLLLFLLQLSLAFSMVMRPLNVRVVSYNVLSNHLCSPQQCPALNPDHCVPASRLSSVLNKLDEEINKKAVICLQEVSYDWAGSLHTHFANRGYHLVTGLYGRKFNGYMGVAIAWPTASMEVLDVNISRLSDTRPEGWPRAPEEDGLDKVWKNLKSLVTIPLQKVGLLGRPPLEPWSYSQNRFNVLLTVKLKEKESGLSFCLGNYHMPCAFFAPMVMTIHSEQAARHVQDLAGDLPYILAGDWNIKPQDSQYKLLTTGELDKEDPGYPPPQFGMEWTPMAEAMQSAYAVADGAEPNFTNYAGPRKLGEDTFIDTLDYIFCGKQWKVVGVKKLQHRDEAGGPFPNLDRDEASDHVLIAADLRLEE